jgi:Glycosyl hydrolase family 20, domain 2
LWSLPSEGAERENRSTVFGQIGHVRCNKVQGGQVLKKDKLKLLPYPRSLKREAGTFVLPARAALHLDATLPSDTVLLPVAERLQSAAVAVGAELELITGPLKHPRLAIRAGINANAPKGNAGYSLEINARGITLGYHDEEGLRAGVAAPCPACASGITRIFPSAASCWIFRAGACRAWKP